MSALADFSHEIIDIGGIALEMRSKGVGRPLVFLHSGDGIHGLDGMLGGLSQTHRVIVPSHPGFGRSDLPRAFNSVDDLAFFYLSLFDRLGLDDILLVGASFGGWIAAQIAVMDCSRIGQLVLIDPLGIKNGDREVRDIADMHALDDEALTARLYSDPGYRPLYETLGEDELLAIARNRESFAYFGWRPYMHDPKLKARLSRVRVPTLVLWGEDDGIVSPDYGRQYAKAIGEARFAVIGRAGHLPHVEQPEAVLAEIGAFASAA
jgi:pimeloyl-ACP methyl ester carboxylesterase